MVYLIHFDQKLHHAQHYIGFVDEPTHKLERRIEYHRKGQGSKLLKALVQKQIQFSVVRTWPEGDRNFERSLKNKKRASQFCPICNPKLK